MKTLIKTSFFLTFFLLSFSRAFAVGTVTVCTATWDSTNEKTIFEAKLAAPPNFRFVELITNSSNWFQEACETGPTCDVLLASAHFSDRFYGPSKGNDFSVSLEDLELDACNNTCPRILGARDTYLFACNTVSGKDQDSRSIQTYVADMEKDGQAQEDAEFLAAMRYGSLGDTYEDRIRDVFSESANIYGYDGAGLLGAQAQPYLIKSFANYTAKYHKAPATLADLENVVFSVPSLIRVKQTPSRSRNSLQCDLLNENASVASRIELIQKAAAVPGESFQRLIPEMTRFFQSHLRDYYEHQAPEALVVDSSDADGQAYLAFRKSQASPTSPLRVQYLKALHYFDHLPGGAKLPTPKLDMAIIARAMEWITPQEYAEDRFDMETDLLYMKNKITEDSSELICESQPLDTHPKKLNGDEVEQGALSETDSGRSALACAGLGDDDDSGAISDPMPDLTH